MAAESSRSNRPISTWLASFTLRSFFTPSYLLILLTSLIVALALTSCGSGGGGSNTGGGFTLEVSGGTLNDGSIPNGLVVLATLRDSQGRGPGAAAGWQITITGPGIITPLIVDYNDGSSSSYITWWWQYIEPQTGTYKASASNGIFTLTRSFTIAATSSLLPGTLSKSGDGTISWPSVTNAGSYYYQIKDGYGTTAYSGYLSSSLTSFVTPALPDGDYQVEVFADTKNRLDLMTDLSSAPSLSAQENMSLSTLSFPVTGSGSGYYLTTTGGVLYMGKDTSVNPAVDQYGLAVWTSIQTSTGGTPPAADWTVTVTGPGISGPLSFTYPATYSHYQYWDFGSVPGPGLYTVSAMNGLITLTGSFTIPNITAKLPVATDLTAMRAQNGDYNVTWGTIIGASSYYVNVWTCVGGINTPTGCDGGIYSEIAGGWVDSPAATILKTNLTNGLVYDVYITASALDMTTINITPPPVPGTQVDMSDTTFTYSTFTAK